MDLTTCECRLSPWPWHWWRTRLAGRVWCIVSRCSWGAIFNVTAFVDLRSKISPFCLTLAFISLLSVKNVVLCFRCQWHTHCSTHGSYILVMRLSNILILHYHMFFALCCGCTCLSMAVIYYCGLYPFDGRGRELHLIRSRLADTFKHNPQHLLRVRLPQIA